MNGSLLFELLAAQSLQISLLACIVLVLTRYFAKDRPHLAHALWALVLLKCLTPPIIASPTSLFSWLSNGYEAVASSLQSPPKEIDLIKTADQHYEVLAPVVVQMSTADKVSVPIATASALKVENRKAKLDVKTWIWVAILAWISLATCVLTLNGLRLWVFLRRVKKKTLPSSPNLNSLVERVSKQIGLRRKVRIRTVDAGIGPAVVGLIRPTILLPKVIVEGKSDAALAPLLAHELVHVRRGDLVWAMLQGMSVSLWWFNPLVWLAERLLTREAERSCDEETIAGLGCSPAMYARCLLDVMERKHQLRAAPSLPGVRPVDITAKRLERIMRLGHGCYRQRPWWVVAVWLAGCAMVLPGAAWVVAQEQPEQKPSVFKEASSNSEGNSQAKRLPRAQVIVKGADLTPPQNKSFEVGSLLTQVCEDQGLSRADAEDYFFQLISSGLTSNGLTSNDLSSSEAIETTTPSSDTAPSFELAGDQVHVRATEKQLEQIERKIEHFRKFGFKPIVTSVTIYEIPQPVLLDKDAFRTGEFLFSDGVEVSSDLGVQGKLAVRNVGVFDDVEVQKLKHWLNEQKGAICTASPTITSLNGQRASAQIGETHSFTVGYKLVKANDGKNDYQPINQKIQTGLECEIRAVITHTDEGEQAMQVSINSRRADIESISTSQFKFSDVDREFTAQNPVVAAATFQSGCQLKLDQSLVVLQWHENKTLVTIVHCEPIGANVAMAPPAMLGKGDKPAYVSVSDQLKSESEIALLTCILAKLGIEDSRIDDGRMQVNVTEDWKAAVNAFQELRDFRNRSSDAVKLTTEPERKFADAGAAYEPLPIFGPLIQRACVARGVPVLSRIPYISTLFRDIDYVDDIDPSVPTDEDVVRALEKQSKDASLSDAFYAGKLKVKSTQILSYNDLVRFVPLANDAYQQHRHFKCSLHDAETDELKSVFYVDYCQFVLKKIGTKGTHWTLP